MNTGLLELEGVHRDGGDASQRMARGEYPAAMSTCDMIQPPKMSPVLVRVGRHRHDAQHRVLVLWQLGHPPMLP